MCCIREANAQTEWQTSLNQQAHDCHAHDVQASQKKTHRITESCYVWLLIIQEKNSQQFGFLRCTIAEAHESTLGQVLQTS